MSSARVIDALFERTVDIVQSLPPSGAIQTSYEEKLALYGLYKQATHGDVDSRRPGMFDMLGRAKWDAWESQRGYAQQDAKQLYIENVLKVLRRFGDRPQAITLMAELEAYSGDIAEQVMDGTLADTASLHSSSVSPSPRARLASSVGEDLAPPAPPAPRSPYRMRRPEGDAHTGSGSHSHDTVTVSDMPRSQAPPSPSAAPRRCAPRQTRARRPRRLRPRRAAHTPRPRAPPAPPSVQSGRYSEGASRSFASAQPSLQEQQPPTRSLRGGPLGRYAPSSVGDRSSSRPVVARRAAPRGGETEQTLRAIQASLVALTERLDRAETTMQQREAAPAHRDAAAVMKSTAQAATNALYDIGVLLGLTGTRTAQVPSYEAWRSGAVYGGPPRASLVQTLLRAPLKFAAQALSVLCRLLLDATSVMLLVSVLMAVLRRISGRGDPWVVLRLLSRASARLRFFEVAANRRAAVRALLASALVGGFVMESRNQFT
ncbi:hypothetical protein MOBT1_001888 [Malassezia obtusa]|uniref:ACB domain-containing protein n=1 Tax=Malassezia obtusa TaxID=76774 RepID=A0AAF0ITH3_9BASI|nr:hypothetical protein MOBT1_001888 [Malassezia obtusa]